MRNNEVPLLPPSFTALLGVILLAGCPDNGTGTQDAGLGPDEVIEIGEDVDEASCEDDLDCPLGFYCEVDICRQIDNDLDNDGYDASVDCDDHNASRHPGRPEICNGIDDDCDGAIDDGVLNACGACGPPPVEICNLIDDDCDTLVDEDCEAATLEEQEPNDGQEACQPIPLPAEVGATGVHIGAFDPPGDLDSYCFFARAGTRLAFDVDSAVLGAPADGVIQLRDATGAPLPGGFNDVGEGPDPYLEYFFPRDQNVRLDLYNFEPDRGGPLFVYELRVTLLEQVPCIDQDGDGSSSCDGDCDDGDGLVFPGQTEVCDGIDNNCDGEIDVGCPSFEVDEVEPNNTPEECQLYVSPVTLKGAIATRGDVDVFCFFVADGTQLLFDIDAKELPSGSQLDSVIELRAAGGALIASNDDGPDPETGIEQDRGDSVLRYTFPLPGIYHLRVRDRQTFTGSATARYVLRVTTLVEPTCTDADADGVLTCEGDCDDNDPTVFFGAEEVCDGIDGNCDGVGDAAACGSDADGDGVTGFDGDCDDDNPLRKPGAPEVCNGLDDDCDGEVDEGVLNACGGCGYPPIEVCDDQVDNDCDGVVDTDCNDDVDQDGVTKAAGDCDDNDPSVHPGAAEVCNGIDDDCDGSIDEFVKNSCGLCAPEPVEECNGLDDDCDGRIDEGALNLCGACGPVPDETCNGRDDDCDGEIDEGVSNRCGGCGPEPLEVCDGVVDDDCDGEIDEGCDVDLDGDGQTPRQGDCRDDLPNVRSGIAETCGDDLDANCDGDKNDGCPPLVESEPNGSGATCDPIPFPAVVTGTSPALDDLDHFCIDITVPGTELLFDVDARELGSALDAQLVVQSEDGTVLGTNNNAAEDPDTGQSTVDPALRVVFPAAGRYFVQVDPVGFAPSGTNTYRLEVDVVGGCVDLDGDGFSTCTGDCDDRDATSHPGGIDICDGRDNDCKEGADDLCVGLCLDDTLEQNDGPATAVLVTSGTLADLQACGGDLDWFRLPVTAGQTLEARIVVTPASATDDVVLELRAPNSTLLATSSPDGPPGSETASVEATVSGEHFLVVSAPLGVDVSYELMVISP